MKLSRAVRHIFYKVMAGQMVLHCLGDSHVQNFQYLSREYLLPKTDMRFCVVQGATNMGLANPHSQTQAMPIFMAYLNNVVSTDHLAFCLGEVDCGFVIWYRADKYGTPIREQFEQSLSNYYSLIETGLTKVPSANMIICSVPLPTIPDHQLAKGEVANKRLGISATQKERTDLTIEYNGRLKELCRTHDMHYLNLQEETLDKQTGLVSKDFLSPNPMDHHLNPMKLSQLIVPRLKQYGLC